MRNARLVEAQARVQIEGRNINNLRYADNITLMVESEEELKSLLMKVKGAQGSNLGLLHCRQTLYPLSHQGSPEKPLVAFIKEQTFQPSNLPIRILK